MPLRSNVDMIKRLAIIAMYSDDELMARLVLKGGNLLDIVLNVSCRASLDLDFSIEGDFVSIDALAERTERTLTTTFLEHGYVVFDFTIAERPPVLTPEMVGFWGGYRIEFKVLEQKRFNSLASDPRKQRMSAIPLGKRGSPKFAIEISKHEFVGDKQLSLLDDFAITVYSPTMVICEKLRAICQQMPVCTFRWLRNMLPREPEIFWTSTLFRPILP